MSRSRRRSVRVIVALMLSALVAAGCSTGDDAGDRTDAPGTSTAESDRESVDPAEAADRSAEFRFAISFGFNSFDPHRSPAPPADHMFMRPLYDQLLTLAHGEDGVELAPQLATSWEYAPDGLSLELELRDDVTFQDGARFDASAVKANLERAMDQASTVKGFLARVERVEVVDPTHVVLRLTSPDPSLPWSFATTPVAMMISPNALGRADLATNPVGSGPWRLVSAAKDGDTVYERWDGHWDPDAALVQRLTISTVADNNSRFNGTRTGELDCAYVAPPLDRESQSLRSEGFHWVQELAPISYGLFLNTTMEPTDDVRVRRAISTAINRQEISEELLGGLQPPAYQVFLEGYLGHSPALDEEVYDPDAARELVQEAGADGATLRIEALTNEPQNSLGQVVQQALGEIGLNVELVPVSPTEYVSSWLAGGKHGQVSLLLAYAEPSQTLDPTYMGRYNLGPPPGDLVAMAEEGLRLPVGSEEREEHYREISAYLVENPIHVPIVQFSTVILCQPDVVGSRNLLKEVVGRLDVRQVGVASS